MEYNSFVAPSIIYKPLIEELCRPMKYLGKIKYFALYIIFNNGQKFIISSTPRDFLSMYWDNDLYKLDHSSELSSFNEADHYLCSEQLGVHASFKKILESRFSMYRTFYTTRQCPECRFIFGALHDHQVPDPATLYQSIASKFEDLCVVFLDQIVNLIKFHNPDYNRSIILNDKLYRKSIIKRNQQSEEQLTEREVDCLYWAAHGKSSEETASILKIKKYTVEQHRKRIKLKLNCSTLAHAIYEGVKRGYIGAFHQLNSDFFKFPNGREIN